MNKLDNAIKDFKFVADLFESAQENLAVPSILIGSGHVSMKTQLRNNYAASLENMLKKAQEEFGAVDTKYKSLFTDFVKSYKERMDKNLKFVKDYTKELTDYKPTDNMVINTKPYVVNLKAKTDAHKLAIGEVITKYFNPKLANIQSGSKDNFNGDYKTIFMTALSNKENNTVDGDFKSVEIPCKMVKEYLDGFGLSNISLLQDQNTLIEQFAGRLREQIEGSINRLKNDVGNFKSSTAAAHGAEIEQRAKKLSRLIALFNDLNETVSLSQTVTNDRMATGEQIAKAIVGVKDEGSGHGDETEQER